uniref:hypothetical protein n=1 Tax=Promicromonospora sp. CA-289581 TaxID=3240013 RepID=UPI003F4988C4
MSDSGTPDVAPPAPVDDDALPETMGLKAVSIATGIPMTTLKRRHLDDLIRLGATKREDGQGYAIPLQAVKELRLFDQVQGDYGTRPVGQVRPARADGPAPRVGTGASGTPGTPGTLPPGALDAEQAAALRAELAASQERERAARDQEMAARERAAAAEATAAERGRTLQMLEAGYVRQLESSQETIRLLEAKVPTPEPAKRRSGWFGRNSPAEEPK